MLNSMREKHHGEVHGTMNITRATTQATGGDDGRRQRQRSSGEVVRAMEKMATRRSGTGEFLSSTRSSGAASWRWRSGGSSGQRRRRAARVRVSVALELRAARAAGGLLLGGGGRL
jgi:hypothetical protein